MDNYIYTIEEAVEEFSRKANRMMYDKHAFDLTERIEGLGAEIKKIFNEKDFIRFKNYTTDAPEAYRAIVSSIKEYEKLINHLRREYDIDISIACGN